MGRSIIIGDVHGCADELESLFDRLALTADDRVVMVGDLVARGPDPRRVVELCRRAGARSVRGNHEDRLLRWRARERTERASAPGRLSHHLRRAGGALDEDAWNYIAAMPLWLELHEHRVLVVHAGVAPRVSLAEQAPRTLMYLRTIGPRGELSEERGETSWAADYEGPHHVVFGHNALPEPQLHPYATGTDTGCVYGGALTALVLPDAERVPPPPERRDALVSVPARRAYAPVAS